MANIHCDICNRDHHPDYIHPDDGWEFRCMRCGHQWRGKRPNEYPKSCSKCHSSYWDRPKIERTTKPKPEPKPKRKRIVRKPRMVEVPVNRGDSLMPPPSMRKR